MQDFQNSFKRINGNTLKVIACISMLIDHITAGIMLPVVRAGLYPDTIEFDTINTIYKILRGVGRTAFPIFCFLLVEGFVHTKNRLRYALSLLIFGIISEPFFDICFYARKEVFNLNPIEVISANKEAFSAHCNVYFTLLIGLIVMWGIELSVSFVKRNNLSIMIAYLFSAIVAGAGIYLAEVVHTDYHGYGVALIAILYVFRNFTPVDIIAGYLFISNMGTEYFAFPGFILMYFYNKKRGRRLGNLKYLFYVFYPVHIMAIIFFRCILFG
jgi:hypothetical protein